MTNYAIADSLNLLSQLLDIHGENSYKAKSYSIAAFAIDKLEVELSDLQPKQIFALKNIGEATGKKILELVETGELEELNSIMARTPAGVLDMLKIKGLGPKKISFLWKELNIDSLTELLQACNANRIAICKGFGEKTQQKIKEGIEFHQKSRDRFLFAQIEEYAHHLHLQLLEYFPEKKIEKSGAIRRQSEIVDELEWVTEVTADAIGQWLDSIEATKDEVAGDKTKATTIDGVKLLFHHVSREEVYTRLLLTSSSEAFLNAFQNSYNISKNYKSEEDIFSSNQLSFIPAYLREDASVLTRGDLNIANIIQPHQIKALIHCHSKWSDGAESLEHMAVACIDRGLEYMVISDHSKTAYYAGGLSEDRITAQQQQVDELNEKFAPFKIFKSIECDILNDGTLDYPDEVLSSFDLVIVSVHSNLSMKAPKAMPRLLKAIMNPYTTILGHMTGRLLLKRNGLEVDHKEIIDACAEHNVAIEINANPRRLDMDWRWVPYALEKGVLISINPDAHSIPEIDNTRYGVLVGQKGGLTQKQNLSSFTLKQFEAYVKKQQGKREQAIH